MMTVATKIGRRCERCNQRIRSRRLGDSIAVLENGRPTSFVCGDCLTLAERAEAVIKESTTEVAVTRDGRFLTRPKVTLPT